ncbi:MAG: 4Fe-4S binding protein [Thermoanaerobacteraceae bacterium]
MRGFGGGRNRQLNGSGFGPDGVCICEKCGTEVPHQRGVPCYNLRCPVCGSTMTRKAGFSIKSDNYRTEKIPDVKDEKPALKYTKPSKPKVDDSLCIGCGNCVRVCPFNAIKIEDGIAYINPEKCRDCGRCIDICPVGAIS